MGEKLTWSDVLRKCITVFEAIRRMSSKGNAGLEAAPGAEDSFRMDSEICAMLREKLREVEAGGSGQEMRDWQQEIMRNGPPERLTLI